MTDHFTKVCWQHISLVLLLPVPGALPDNKEGETRGNGLGSLVELLTQNAGKEKAGGVSCNSLFL